jgi:hypothetical protein
LPNAKLISAVVGIAEEIESRKVQPETEVLRLTVPDMPAEVLAGRLGEITQRRMARFPRSYSWPSILACAGLLVPRSNQMRTNLYAALVGEVHSGKSQAAETAQKLLGIEKPLLLEVFAGSAEGLVRLLEDTEGAARLWNPDELSHTLEKANIERASFPYILNSAYYKDEFPLTSAGGKTSNFNSRLSILGGIVEENFGHSFGSATTGGLYDRFIFGRSPAPFDFIYRPYEGTPEEVQPTEVWIAPEVWEAKDEWGRENEALRGRVGENAVRAAVICASFDGQKILTAKHLAPARALAEYQARVRLVLRPNPGENTDARCAFAILQALPENAAWANRRELYQRIHGNRFGPGAFDRAVSNLQFNEQVETKKEGRANLMRLVP